MTLLRYLTLYLLFVPLAIYGQKPDFQADSLYVVEGGKYLHGKRDLKAYLQMYCDGSAISMMVEVRDDLVDIERTLKDHIDLWLALPASAYPEGFSYQTHPFYAQSVRKPNEPSRLFSPHGSRNAQRVRPEVFSSLYDYPSIATINTEKLVLPLATDLKVATVPYGVVHLGLALDKNQVTVYDRDSYKPLAEMLKTRLGAIDKGIKYYVEFTDNGYIVNIQVKPQALGFVQLPTLADLRFAVDVVDIDYPMAKPTIISSAKNREAYQPATFSYVKFSKPLRTNETKIPDFMLEKSGVRPHYIYTDSGWIATNVSTDVIAYRPEKLSGSLAETRFSQQPVRYFRETDESSGVSAQVLTQDIRNINLLPSQQQFYVIDDQLLRTETLRVESLDVPRLRNSIFRYADSRVGVVIEQSLPVNPYGWGKCSTCIERNMFVYRIMEGKKWKILTIEQFEGNTVTCQVNGQQFPGFKLSHWDWVKKGEVMVLWLENPNTRQKKRVKVSWDEYGNDVKVKLL